MPDTILPQFAVNETSRRPSPLVETLASRFENRTARIAVMGLGYVGLPLALTLVAAGFATTGLDSDAAKVARLAAGESTLRQVPAARLRGGLENGRLAVTGSWSALAAVDAILICVPPPPRPPPQPDPSAGGRGAQRDAGPLP